ncbi:MAG: hypothetical protein ACQERS_09700 [Bacteroidota bacterium]
MISDLPDGHQGLYKEAKTWYLQIYRKKDLLPVRLQLIADWLYASYFETPEEEIMYLKQILEIDDQSPVERYLLLYRQALSLEPESALRLNNLAYLLIDEEINIREGLQLVDKALESKPGNYKYLHTKGWGLYKEGKYKEAYNILQKSWDLRRENAVYNHEAFHHLEAAKKAVAGN